MPDPVPPELVIQRRNDLASGRALEIEPEVKEVLRNAARTAHVVGGVLAGISATGPLKRPGTWLAMIGRHAVGLVEAAIPGTLPHYVARFLSIAYLFGALMALLGLVTDFGDPLLAPGVTVLVVAGALDLLILVLSAVMKSWSKLPRILGITAGILVVLCAILLEAIGLREVIRQWHW